MPPGSSPPGPVELPGGGLSLRLPHAGARAMADVDSPTYSTLTISAATLTRFSEGALALSRPTTGLPVADRPAGRYNTDPIARRERGHIERTYALLHWPETEGAGVMASGMPTGCPFKCGVGGTTYSVVKVHPAGSRHAGGSGPPVGRTLAPASQSAPIRGARYLVYLPRPVRGLGVRRPRHAPPACVGLRGGDRLKLAAPTGESIAHVCWLVSRNRRRARRGTKNGGRRLGPRRCLTCH